MQGIGDELSWMLRDAALGFALGFVPTSLVFLDLKIGVIAGLVSAFLAVLPSRHPWKPRPREVQDALLRRYVTSARQIAASLLLGLVMGAGLMLAMIVASYFLDRDLFRDIVHGKLEPVWWKAELMFGMAMGVALGMSGFFGDDDRSRGTPSDFAAARSRP
jgi:hypothetical protein